jgi:thiol-disulfide isomerase/thioredoxin
MTKTLRALLPLALGAFLLSGLAIAAEKSSFTTAAFEAAQKAGKPILIDIAASWCPTCKAQAPILEELAAEPRFKDLQIFTVDFDTEKSVLREFRAQVQSTLIVFKGGQEVGRSVGDTHKGSIAALLAKSL